MQKKVKKKNCDDVGSHSEVSEVSRGVRCKLLDWYEDEDVIVGEREFCSAEGTYTIGGKKIGLDTAAAIVTTALNPEFTIFRPTADMYSLQKAVRKNSLAI